MFKFKTFTGIDIQKRLLMQPVIFAETGIITHQCFNQNKEGFGAFINWLHSKEVNIDDTLICMEHTGLYPNGIIEFLTGLKANLWVEMVTELGCFTP